MAKSISERFWSKVRVLGPDDCWEWQASCRSKKANGVGYGQFWLVDRIEQAHRVAYEMLVGPIPEGLQLDHLCRNTICVNPHHLEPVTPAENYRRGVGVGGANFRKTHCDNGHSFDEENTYVYPDGGRSCRACNAGHLRELRRRRGAGMANSDKTHCPKGHPYDEENTIHDGGSRKCRACRREYYKRYDAARTPRRRAAQ